MRPLRLFAVVTLCAALSLERGSECLLLSFTDVAERKKWVRALRGAIKAAVLESLGYRSRRAPQV